MASDHETGRSQLLNEDTRKVVQAFDQLDTDAKLAFLYYVYEKMGKSVTPAAPSATDPGLAPKLLGDFYNLGDDDQLAIMRQIVNREDSEYSRAYGSLKENNQLMVWFAWAQGMGDTVVDLPDNYNATQSINDVLSQIENLGFEHQISMLREIAANMGYSDIQPIPTQAETGKTSSL